MKNYRKNFKSYFKDLSRRKPSPGGGSVACLSFCLGVSLLEKAVNYSLPKVGAHGRAPLQNGLKTLGNLKSKIYPGIDRDAQIFTKIMVNHGAERLKFIRQSEVLIVGLARASLKAFLVAKALKSGIKKGIISDYTIGLGLIKIAFFGCIANLEDNAKMFGKKNSRISAFKRALKKWQ